MTEKKRTLADYAYLLPEVRTARSFTENIQAEMLVHYPDKADFVFIASETRSVRAAINGMVISTTLHLDACWSSKMKLVIVGHWLDSQDPVDDTQVRTWNEVATIEEANARTEEIFAMAVRDQNDAAEAYGKNLCN